jgi:hypothetical protein
MDALGLVSRHADVPVGSLSLAPFSHLGLTEHADPDNGQVLERGLQSSLGFPAGKKDLVDDDADAIAGPRHGCQTLVPGCLSPTELVPDNDGAVGRELERAACSRVGGAM